LGEIDEGKTIDFQRLMMRKAHLEQLKGKIVEQVQVREDAEEEKNLQREALVQAMKDKKILEEDKEKKRGLWKKVMKKEEMKFLDEIASIAFSKRARAEKELADSQKRKAAKSALEEEEFDA